MPGSLAASPDAELLLALDKLGLSEAEFYFVSKSALILEVLGLAVFVWAVGARCIVAFSGCFDLFSSASALEKFPDVGLGGSGFCLVEGAGMSTGAFLFSM